MRSDKWELFRLDEDFSETNDSQQSSLKNLQHLVKLWMEEAEKHKVHARRPLS